MLFNTMQYLVFLPIVVVIYYILPQKTRYIWLLAASYYFYMQWNPLYIMLIFSCTFLTYVSGRIIGRLRELESNLAADNTQTVWGGGMKEGVKFVLQPALY